MVSPVAIGAFIVILILTVSMCIKEGMVNQRKMIEARNIVAIKPLFDTNNDTFAKTKRVHSDLDAAEYMDIRKVMKNCTTDCARDVYKVLD